MKSMAAWGKWALGLALAFVAVPIGVAQVGGGVYSPRDTLTTIVGTLGASKGGTGNTSYTVGDILYASGATTLSKLADAATGNALISGGVGVAPSYGKVALTTHVSGQLPVANGGTASATGQAAASALSLPYVLSNTSTASTALTGTTSETVLGWINVPANYVGTNGCVNLGTIWNVTGSAGAWTRLIRVAAGTSNGSLVGTQLMGGTVSAGLNVRGDELICNNNSASAQFMFNNAANPWNATSNGLGTSAINTTSAWTISINASLANAADSLVLKHLHSLLIQTAGN